MLEGILLFCPCRINYIQGLSFAHELLYIYYAFPGDMKFILHNHKRNIYLTN